ncbi:hypothetical protein NECAME_04424 [Necator americanus]|uniref:ABC transporter domain-containing protein n=1 Tax=Necator americanus TaxID=51031 RepID=W2SVJ7_NECAM|nr:hypothetical protein NECAME_04424 [Necator americanus]ETN72816.1 hypothetical protein NECAME_04424 [Necator americanus]
MLSLRNSGAVVHGAPGSRIRSQHLEIEKFLEQTTMLRRNFSNVEEMYAELSKRYNASVVGVEFKSLTKDSLSYVLHATVHSLQDIMDLKALLTSETELVDLRDTTNYLTTNDLEAHRCVIAGFLRGVQQPLEGALIVISFIVLFVTYNVVSDAEMKEAPLDVTFIALELLGLNAAIFGTFCGTFYRRRFNTSRKKEREQLKSQSERHSWHQDEVVHEEKADIDAADVAKVWERSGELAVYRFEIRAYPGEVSVLLGHSGAGKSTVCKMICGIVRPTRAIAFIGGSRVVLLDEPTNGMDPPAIGCLVELVQQQKDLRTIMLTTERMEDAEAMGQQLYVMYMGRTVCSGDINFVKSSFATEYMLTITPSDENFEETAKRLEEVGLDLGISL